MKTNLKIGPNNKMEKITAVKNFVSFVIPISILLACKVVLPVNMYNSLVNFTADNLFMPPSNNIGMCNMYEKTISPRKFLMWTTSNIQAIKSTFSNMMLEMGCLAHVGAEIDEEIEFIEYKSLNPIKLSSFNIPDDESENYENIVKKLIKPSYDGSITKVINDSQSYSKEHVYGIEDSKPIVLNIGSAS